MTRARSPVDLLLLNAANLPAQPVYPYAFVQLTAIARRHGLSVERLDLLNHAPPEWPHLLREQIRLHRPRLVGLHVRQLDTLLMTQYTRGSRYFPALQTRDAIRVVRRETASPIVIGGFGFSSNARAMADYLEPDLACLGSPDALFGRFEDLLAGRSLESIDNLVFREGDGYRWNQQVHHPPATFREYDEVLTSEIEAFYGQETYSSATTVAVEVSRGCPYRCYFCNDPFVKGRSVRYRDLDVVMEEIEFLALRGLRRVFLVCSELNIGGTAFAVEVAERILRLNERGLGVTWTAYVLPTLLDDTVLELLARSGYRCAWNEAQSLSDTNLRRARVPYRSKHILEFLTKSTANGLLPSPEGGRRITLFLGNVYADEEMVRTTVERFQVDQLKATFAGAEIIVGTRVFETGDGKNCSDVRAMRVFDPDAGMLDAAATDLDLVHPTFSLPPKLLAALGSVAAIEEFFRFVADTFLSNGHVAKRDWSALLARHLAPQPLRALVCDSVRVLGPLPLHRWVEPTGVTVRPILEDLVADREHAFEALLSPPDTERLAYNHAAAFVSKLVLKAHPRALEPGLRRLGLEAGSELWSEYRLMRHLYSRYASSEELWSDAAGLADAERFSLAKLLFEKNVVIDPAYRPWLFPPNMDRAMS